MSTCLIASGVSVENVSWLLNLVDSCLSVEWHCRNVLHRPLLITMNILIDNMWWINSLYCSINILFLLILLLFLMKIDIWRTNLSNYWITLIIILRRHISITICYMNQIGIGFLLNTVHTGCVTNCICFFTIFINDIEIWVWLLLAIIVRMVQLRFGIHSGLLLMFCMSQLFSDDHFIFIY